MPQVHLGERSILDPRDVEHGKEGRPALAIEHFGYEPAVIVARTRIDRLRGIRNKNGLADIMAEPEVKCCRPAGFRVIATL